MLLLEMSLSVFIRLRNTLHSFDDSFSFSLISYPSIFVSFRLRFHISDSEQ